MDYDHMPGKVRDEFTYPLTVQLLIFGNGYVTSSNGQIPHDSTNVHYQQQNNIQYESLSSTRKKPTTCTISMSRNDGNVNLFSWFLKMIQYIKG